MPRPIFLDGTAEKKLVFSSAHRHFFRNNSDKGIVSYIEMARDVSTDWNHLEELLRSRGVRVTHQRLEILRELVSSDGHPSAEQVHESVVARLPAISLDTVYRTIALFEEMGLIRRVEVLDDRGRFDANLEPHHHLVCVRCKRIEDIHWPEFDRLLPPPETESWGRVSSRHVEFRGLCRECLEKESQ